MNTNENLEKMRKNARAMVKWGVVLMSSSLVLVFITLFYFYAIVIPANQGKEMPSLPIVIEDSLCIEALIFVPGFLLFLFGLIDLLKKRESR